MESRARQELEEDLAGQGATAGAVEICFFGVKLPSSNLRSFFPRRAAREASAERGALADQVGQEAMEEVGAGTVTAAMSA